MEIETESNNSYSSNIKSNNLNIPYNLYNPCYIQPNQYYQNLFAGKNILKKRTYNELLNNTNNIGKIQIKEKEVKYLNSLLSQIKKKLDSQTPFINSYHFQNNENIIKEKEDDENKSKGFISIDCASLYLKDIILQLYQNDKTSDELKRFLLRKIISNAIEIEKTFHNYFNINYFPNKKYVNNFFIITFFIIVMQLLHIVICRNIKRYSFGKISLIQLKA